MSKTARTKRMNGLDIFLVVMAVLGAIVFMVATLSEDPAKIAATQAEPPQALNAAPVNSLAISTSLEPEERPKFKRTYKARLTDEVSIKVTIRHTSYGGTYDVSELTQRDGRWVLFDLDRPADKILDRELLPIVEKYCAEIRRMDKEFRRNLPREFVDDRGVRWVTVQP